MSSEKLLETVIENSKNITTLTESVKSAHKRIDEQKKITESIHKLSEDVAVIAQSVKAVTEYVGKEMEKIRLLQNDQATKINEVERKGDERERYYLKEKNKKADAVLVTVIAGLVLAVIAYFLGVNVM